MKFSSATAIAACATAATARFIEPFEADSIDLFPTKEQFLIELAPGETRWVTEDEKWELRRVGSS